ncbi:hypothetical protein S7711_11237 [Stachybotrys chartarum IBT 7711]|uniref:Stc1 domain-containing protein n=1 Tax=Stachybotrys chartarum (strain CBS 109288 / IBT 7711) TaxID=1280523 RepID=A0A084AIQ8_STACB|nr:hypothetical protein S7711_11237 [Stachybotrys chartarum IBT 7711]KFA74853.1 hypothetical protein S40288_10809 [Stachybotrys chartarum IBT 40288]
MCYNLVGYECKHKERRRVACGWQAPPSNFLQRFLHVVLPPTEGCGRYVGDVRHKKTLCRGCLERREEALRNHVAPPPIPFTYATMPARTSGVPEHTPSTQGSSPSQPRADNVYNINAAFAQRLRVDERAKMFKEQDDIFQEYFRDDAPQGRYTPCWSVTPDLRRSRGTASEPCHIMGAASKAASNPPSRPPQQDRTVRAVYPPEYAHHRERIEMYCGNASPMPHPKKQPEYKRDTKPLSSLSCSPGSGETMIHYLDPNLLKRKPTRKARHSSVSYLKETFIPSHRRSSSNRTVSTKPPSLVRWGLKVLSGWSGDSRDDSKSVMSFACAKALSVEQEPLIRGTPRGRQNPTHGRSKNSNVGYRR